MAEDDHAHSYKWLRRDDQNANFNHNFNNNFNNDVDIQLDQSQTKPIRTTSTATGTATATTISENTTSVEKSHRTSRPASLRIVRILAIFARAIQQLQRFDCLASILTLQSLPRSQYQSALTCQLLGRAYFELNEYKSAAIAFREMLRREPQRLSGLETFSSALWHLKRDQELAALAQTAVGLDRQAPETWCVLGNLFSLQREPQLAIKFFHRALQVNPHFAYAHTLSGHEYVIGEDLEKAILHFRRAVAVNDRHYNAWYGLGSIFFRQERFELSEFHFRRAREINDQSSVLDCYLSEWTLPTTLPTTVPATLPATLPSILLSHMIFVYTDLRIWLFVMFCFVFFEFFYIQVCVE